MKNKLYFQDEDSEICYSEDHFQDLMKDENLEEIEVFKAIPDSSTGFFWCYKYQFVGDDSKDSCGKQCSEYKPRNGKSGCCKHYTTKLYEWGEKVTLKRKYDPN